jgi:hypothetical protein
MQEVGGAGLGCPRGVPDCWSGGAGRGVAGRAGSHDMIGLDCGGPSQA